MPRERLRWGLLSTARINERLIPAIRQCRRSQLLAVSSRDEERARVYAENWDIPRWYGSYDGLLRDDEIDAIYISLPNSHHADWATKAAEAGKHVLCEKLLALTVAQVDRMAAAATANGVILQEAAMYRYHPQTNKVRELIQERAMGEVVFVQAKFGFTLTNDPDILREPEKGGGSLWDIGSYPVSLTRAVLGEEPLAVMGWQQTNAAGVDMSFAGQLLFPSGAVLQFTSSFATVPNWEVHFLGSDGLIRLDHPYLNRVGSGATVDMLRGGGAAQVTFGDSTDHLIAERIHYEDCNAYRDEVENFQEVILDAAEPTAAIPFSRGNVATIVGLYQSARENRIVNLVVFQLSLFTFE